MVTSGRFELTAEPTPLNQPSVDGSQLCVFNAETGGGVSKAAYLGAPDVTAADGHQLNPGERVGVELDPQDVLYAISPGSAVITVLRS